MSFVSEQTETSGTDAKLTVVILTKDEELHIERAIESVKDIACRCIVVDSGSSDRTVELARDAGAEIMVHPFVSQAQQFNWALAQLPSNTQWVMRLDADEIVTPELRQEIKERLSVIDPGIMGIVVSRRMCFLSRPILWGGVFPIRLVRLLRHGHGRSEDRWMDEHLLVDGPVAEFIGEIVDDNRNSLTWWIAKHNTYASREAIELLNVEYCFIVRTTVSEHTAGSHKGAKRWLKEKFYGRLPIGLRAQMYFLYRYIFRLGFLDGREGKAFHVLQGFWYRYLVDMKVHEVRTYMRNNNVEASEAIHVVLGIDLSAHPSKSP